MDRKEAMRKIRDISEQVYEFSPSPEKYEITRGVAQAHRRINELAKSLTVILESIFSDKER